MRSLAPRIARAQTTEWAIVFACIAALLGLFGRVPWCAVFSAIFSAFAAILVIARGTPARREIGLVVWILNGVGAVLAAAGAMIATLETPTRWPSLLGAAVAAAVVVIRDALDARARHPVDDVVHELLGHMPARVRIPTPDSQDTTNISFHEVETDRVRTGEEIFALENETVAVDGVVKAGEALVLLHPGAKTPVKRGPGDAILAGAHIVEGGVRILATRVASDRALVRPQRFGIGGTRDSAPITNIAEATTRWGGLAVGVASLGALALSGSEGWAGRLSATAAVLLAAPLLAIRRGAQLPMIAGAATAGARGIVFQDPRSMERAGRARVAVLCTHGTVTEGVPEVVEVHPFDNSTPESFVALAAAAEAAAESHPIARAISRFAESRGVQPESVRRAAFLPGRGVTAVAPGGEAFVFGNRQLLLDEGVSVALADADAARSESRGRTAVFLGLGGHVRAVISFADTLRHGARAAVQTIIDLGIEVVLLSGDHRGTVEAIAKSLDIDHVKAELLPDERGAEVRRLREAGGAVAVIGRAIHDDGALAAASVPIVLGAAGGPSGDRAVALATEDIRDAAAALWIARAARTSAWQATGAAVVVGATCVVGAALGIISPAFAALAVMGVDAYALPAGARLLRRIDLRMPARS